MCIADQIHRNAPGPTLDRQNRLQRPANFIHHRPLRHHFRIGMRVLLASEN